LQTHDFCCRAAHYLLCGAENVSSTKVGTIAALARSPHGGDTCVNISRVTMGERRAGACARYWRCLKTSFEARAQPSTKVAHAKVALTKMRSRMAMADDGLRRRAAPCAAGGGNTKSGKSDKRERRAHRRRNRQAQ
jgi:hypothetical protein